MVHIWSGHAERGNELISINLWCIITSHEILSNFVFRRHDTTQNCISTFMSYSSPRNTWYYHQVRVRSIKLLFSLTIIIMMCLVLYDLSCSSFFSTIFKNFSIPQGPASVSLPRNPSLIILATLRTIRALYTMFMIPIPPHHTTALYTPGDCPCCTGEGLRNQNHDCYFFIIPTSLKY